MPSAIIARHMEIAMELTAETLEQHWLLFTNNREDLSVLADVRGYGLLAGIEIKAGNVPGVRGAELQAKLFDRGLHVKTTDDVAIMAPALIASRAEIDQMTAILRDALSEY